MSRVIVVGAGAMGLAAAYHAVRAGHEVEMLEAGREPGGMAAHFDFGDLSVERFYHFICKADQPLFDLLAELDIADRLRWRRTSTGQFAGGRLHVLGDPVSLLRYDELSLISRVRYGFFAFVSTRRNRWDSIERDNAKDWIVRWCGPEVYRKMWEPLLRLKFFRYADNISAAWIWTRIKRIGTSRSSMFAEQLGYLEGGSQTLVDRLVDRITAGGGTIRLGAPVSRIRSAAGRVTGVETALGFHPADIVISTMPTPLVSDIVPDLPEDWRRKYDAIENIGVCCLVFKLRRSVTPHFWVNISDPDIAIPGIIEFSNLRPMPGGETIVYVPYYMPVDHPKFAWSDKQLLDEAFGYLRRLNPALGDGDIVDAKVARLRHAQPICEPGFADKIPPVETPIAGLQIADTCFYYPEDRGISESVRFARDMVARLPAIEADAAPGLQTAR